MAQITRATKIGELLKCISRISSNLNGNWNALSWMPIFTDGVIRRSSYGSWTGC